MSQPPAHGFWDISRLRSTKENLHLVRVVCGHAGAAGLPPPTFFEEELLQTRSTRTRLKGLLSQRALGTIACELAATTEARTVLINRSSIQKHHNELCRKKEPKAVKRFRAIRCVPPEPASDSRLPVP